MLGPACTDRFASPEQRQGDVRNSSDVYSLGCVVVYMLSGARPRSACNIPQVLPLKLAHLLASVLHTSSDARLATRAVQHLAQDLAALVDEDRPRRQVTAALN